MLKRGQRSGVRSEAKEVRGQVLERGQRSEKEVRGQRSEAKKRSEVRG